MALDSFQIDDVDIMTLAPTGVDILIRDVVLPFTKPKTRHKVEIPGRDYAWDFGGEKTQDFPIKVELYILGDTWAKALECARSIESAIAGETVLIFDEEPTVSYTVKVYGGVDANREGTTGIQVTIPFECSGTGVVATGS